MVECPVCAKTVKQHQINLHLDSDCADYVETNAPSSQAESFFKRGPTLNVFKTPIAKRSANGADTEPSTTPSTTQIASKRPLGNGHSSSNGVAGAYDNPEDETEPVPKRQKGPNAFQRAAPLAERMRPKTLDDICGQELVGSNGVLRGLIEQDRVPSMILWGGAGTGKTTIARVIASMVGSRFVEINSTSSGVGECKKLFAEAKNELGLSGRKTIIFCDEIHRFSKSQQDVFLGPVEAGTVTLIGATTENPSFKVQNALLSRCRTFTLQKLADENIQVILSRALEIEREHYQPSALVDEALLQYLAAFADGDARTALNLLELAMDLSKRAGMSENELKKSLTKTLVYDRAGDQHYDTSMYPVPLSFVHLPQLVISPDCIIQLWPSLLPHCYDIITHTLHAPR